MGCKNCKNKTQLEELNDIASKSMGITFWVIGIWAVLGLYGLINLIGLLFSWL